EDEIRKALARLDDKEKLEYKHSHHMESAADAARRLLTFLQEVAISYPGKTILVVAHGNIMRSFLPYVGYVSYDELPKNSIKNTGYIVLESKGTHLSIKETYNVNKQSEAVRLF